MPKRILTAAAAILLLTLTPSLACKGPNVQFSDDFREVDASWAAEPGNVSVEEGRVKIKANPNGGYNLMYNGAPFDDADICITVRMPNDVDAKDETAAGLLFWGVDYDNFYWFAIAPDGKATLQRKLKGKYSAVVAWKESDQIKIEHGAKNALRVTTSGNSITLWINDAKFGSVKGAVPAGGGLVGLRSESETAKRDTWKFSDLKVTDLAPQ